MAIIRAMTEIPETYEKLTWKFLKMLPLGYNLIDIVCDTYQECSLKSAERNKRCCSSKMIIRLYKAKIPRDFKGFLKNWENKAQLTELVRDVISSSKVEVLGMPRCKEILFSTCNHCLRLPRESTSLEPLLESNQEEADTKLMLHCVHSLTNIAEKNVVVRSPSGDADVTVLMLSKLVNYQDRVFLTMEQETTERGYGFATLSCLIQKKNA